MACRTLFFVLALTSAVSCTPTDQSSSTPASTNVQNGQINEDAQVAAEQLKEVRWKRLSNDTHICTEEGCRPRVEVKPKHVSKRSTSSSSSEEKKKRKNKKCKYCEERKRRATQINETETENQESRITKLQTSQTSTIPPQECVGEGCTPKPRVERSASKSKSKSKEDDEYKDDEDDEDEDDEEYSDEKPKPKKVVKKPKPKTTKLQDLFGHFNG